MIYLDNASTSWPKPECVYRAVDDCLRGVGGNPGRGGHESTILASRLIYEARENIANLFNVSDPTRIAWMFSATDAINTALFGLFYPGDIVIATGMEHNSVSRCLHQLEKRQVVVRRIVGEQNGRVNLSALQCAIRDGAQGVISTHASNVNGVIMPIDEIGAMTSAARVPFVVDAAQTAGVEKIDVIGQNIDVLAFSCHKALMGPQGTAGLFVREGIVCKPMRFGGTGSNSEQAEQPEFMPDSLESGTLNSPGIAGVLAASRYIQEKGISVIKRKKQELTLSLVEGLREISGVEVFGHEGSASYAAVVSVRLAGIDHSNAGNRLNQEYGIACRTGLHCAPWAHRALNTMSSGLIRFSPGYFNSQEDISLTVQAVREIMESQKYR